MFSNKIYIYLITIFLSLAFWSQQAKALGPEILSPVQNTIVDAGQNVDIVFRYSNKGIGTYTMDVALWSDSKVTSLIQKIATVKVVSPGDSNPVSLSFHLDDKYTMKVPDDLNGTFWLSLTETFVSKNLPMGLTLRSRPVILHTREASTSLPSSQSTEVPLKIQTFT